MRQHVDDRRVAFRWNPQQETCTAILGVLALFAVYRASTLRSLGHPVASEWAFALFGGPIVATLLPALAVRGRRGAQASCFFASFPYLRQSA